MRRLVFPQILGDPLAIVREGLGPGRALTGAEQAELQALFDFYRQNGGRSDLVQSDAAFNQAHGADMRFAYSQTYNKGRLAYVRSSLKKAAGNRCTSCGGSRHDQLDHHLPKSNYGEFACFVFNLLPCCGGCNLKKKVYVGATADTAFVHPFFDAIPDQPYICVEINHQPNTITFTLSFDDAAPFADPQIRARMKTQFEEVDVNARVESEVIEFATEQADTIIQECQGAQRQAIADHLGRAADRLGRSSGHGSWRVAVLRAMAADVVFCDGAYRLIATP